MTRPIIIAARFFLAIILVTITAQIAWNELVDRSLYHCTDDLLELDFVFPSSWVHNSVAVQDLHKPRSDGRDTIKEGWTVMDLWCLWSWMFLLSQLAIFSIGGGWELMLDRYRKTGWRQRRKRRDARSLMT